MRFNVLWMFYFIIFIYLLLTSNMSNLPEGELLKSSYSPNKKYIVNVFLVNGGATVDFAIRCELVDTTSGKEKNIYWNYHEDDATVEWKDNDTVIINGHVLNVPEDEYDWRDFQRKSYERDIGIPATAA